MLNRRNKRLSEFNTGSVYSNDTGIIKLDYDTMKNVDNTDNMTTIVDLQQVYHIGIVNYLETWTLSKRINYAFE